MLDSLLSNVEDKNDYSLFSTDKTVNFYYKPKTRIQNSRFSDFVVFPQKPTLIFLQNDTSNQPPPILDYDSDGLMQFSLSTISILKNSGKKVYPFPIIPEQLDKTTAEYQIFKLFSLEQCKQNILNEKQYVPTFHIIGHGTPTGIGFLDPVLQISPTHFAKNISLFFKQYGLNQLADRPISFVFHTCNSAYADVNSSWSKETILETVKQQSFIGRFYAKMQALGYDNISVTGYRGYYRTVTSNKSSAAMVQDAIHSPTVSLMAINSQYTIHDGECTTSAKIQYLSFPVQLLNKKSMLESVDNESEQLLPNLEKSFTMMQIQHQDKRLKS